jgi:hypothetical protein
VRTRVGRRRKPRSDLEKQLKTCRRELAEARVQQTATTEVLRVISTSGGDLQPAFETLLANATHICGAKFGVLWLSEGDVFRAVALHGAPASFLSAASDLQVANAGADENAQMVKAIAIPGGS